MKTEDIPDVQKVAKASWKNTYKGIIPAEIQKSFLQAAYHEAMMKKRLDSSFLFVAEADGKILGFADYLPVKPDGTAELSAIYLYPEYQGKGLGTALLMEGIKNLKNVKAITTDVEKENRMGMAFYQAKGFQPTAEFDEDFEGYILKTVKMILNV
jgi:ribosomal protein S18 acetylase RimI-like enzyme